MQLVIILLIAVSLLTFLSGVAVLSGAKKGERFQAALFFFITVFALGWAVGIGMFFGLPEDADENLTRMAVYLIYLPSLVMSWGLAAYPIYRYKIGKAVMIFYGLFCIFLISSILSDTNVLYGSITLSEARGNVVHLHQNWFNILYAAYFITTCLVYMIGLWYNARKARNARIKKANLMVLAGFTVTGVIALVFDVILPFMGTYGYIWAGPLAMSFAWIFHYYAILRYRLLDITGRWLKGLSYVIIMTLAAIVYLTIFFIIFIALFNVQNPSLQVIVLNAIMIAIVLLLMPVLNEVSSFIQSLASTQEVDIAYIAKKLQMLSRENLDFYELSDFLADHLHFKYVGLKIGDKLYGSKQARSVAQDAVKQITKKAKSKSIWVDMDDEMRNALKKQGVEGVIELRNPSEETVGYMVFGKPVGNVSFANRDLEQVEVAAMLVAVMIDRAERNPRLR